jgi:hypothetical protein
MNASPASAAKPPAMPQELNPGPLAPSTNDYVQGTPNHRQGGACQSAAIHVVEAQHLKQAGEVLECLPCPI